MDLVTSKALTMSSRDIAELTGKDHKHVLRDARLMIEDLHGPDGSAQFWANVPDSLGRPQPVLNLPRRECLILVSGYSVQMRARIIDRWQELEDSQAPQVPATFAAALRLAADQAEKLALQAAELDKARPAVEFVDRYVDAQGGVTFRELAKLLGEKEWILKIWLIEKGVLHLSGTSMVPYAKHAQAGRVFVKAGIAGNGRAYSQTLFTPKGVAWVCGLYRSGK